MSLINTINIKGFMGSTLDDSLVITNNDYTWLDVEHEMDGNTYAVPMTQIRHLCPFILVRQDEDTSIFEYTLPQQHTMAGAHEKKLIDMLFIKRCSENTLMIIYIDAYTQCQIRHYCSLRDDSTTQYDVVEYNEINTSKNKTPLENAIGYRTEFITSEDVNHDKRILSFFRNTSPIVLIRGFSDVCMCDKYVV